MNDKSLTNKIRQGALLLVLVMNPTMPLLAEPSQSERSETPEQLRQAAEAVLSQPRDWQAIVNDRASGRGSEGMHGIDWDIRNLSPAQLEFKYGDQGHQINLRLLSGSNQNFADAAASAEDERESVSFATVVLFPAVVIAFLLFLKALNLPPFRREQSLTPLDRASSRSVQGLEHGDAMFCVQCGAETATEARFCGKCGAPVQAGENLGASRYKQTPASPRVQLQQADANGSDAAVAKPMHLAAYLGLCFGAWLVGALVANGVSILMGAAYAEATAATVIGFWVGKALLKNKRRDWGGIVAFPIITFIAGLVGSAIGEVLVLQNPGSVNYSALISLVVAFGLSCGLFAVLRSSHSR